MRPITWPELPKRFSTLVTDADAPLQQGRYRSPLRDETIARRLGFGLGIMFGICFLTGVWSHLQQDPVSWLPLPSRPAGLYRVTQGTHVATGLASIPLLAAKLWVVWPRFVSYPPAKRAGHALERLALLPLVAGALFLVFTGVANIAIWYPWRFDFRRAHFWVAWLTIGALLVHLALKLPKRHGSPDAPAPGSGNLSRRGFLWSVAAASGLVTVATIGQTFRPLRGVSALAVRDPAVGPQGVPVNRAAVEAGAAEIDQAAWRLVVEGDVDRRLELSYDDVLAMPASTHRLPIACVEGWSAEARWRGVAVRDVLEAAGAREDAVVDVISVDPGPFGRSTLGRAHAEDGATLLATHINGERLHRDHGFPLRLIAPNRPGVHQTKWVVRLVVR